MRLLQRLICNVFDKFTKRLFKALKSKECCILTIGFNIKSRGGFWYFYHAKTFMSQTPLLCINAQFLRNTISFNFLSFVLPRIKGCIF
jgi:hypothetical protein